MSSEPKESKSSDRLPFEPASKKPAKPKVSAPAASDRSPAKSEKKSTTTRKPARESSAIPEQVSKRMGRRMAFFSGIPTTFGVLTFLVSYLLVTQFSVKLPNVAVVLVSMGFFGLGVVGLSYGLLSSSWDEERSGSLLGGEEFSTNVGRMTAAWREARETARRNKSED
jgi:Photosynthesis affected mutant 68